MFWENEKLIAVGYEKDGYKAITHQTRINNGDIIMNFIGQYDKNNKELWTGDIVKFDPKGHGNYILGVISYDVRVTSFTIEQLTYARDFYQTQEELDEEYQNLLKSFLQKNYQFDSPTNWYNVTFYDEMGANFSYSELEVVGTLYKNSGLIVQKQQHQDYVKES